MLATSTPGVVVDDIVPAPSDTSIDAALKAYVAAVESNPTVEDSTRRRSIETVAALRRYAAALVPAIDLSQNMGSLGYADLERLTNYVKGRPISPTTGKAISVFTVKTVCQKWRECFNWIDKNESRFGWVLPRRADELFTVDLGSIRSKAERDASANGTDTLVPRFDEIKAYLDEADEYQKLLILTAVCTAMGQREMASVTRPELDLTNGVCRHYRNKTGVLGVHHLPAELVKRLETYFGEVPAGAGGIAFLTIKRNPIVDDATDTDSVAQFWAKLRAKVKAKADNAAVRDITFYDLRRVLPNHPEVLKRKLDDVALSQTHKTVNRVHYTPSRDGEHAELLAVMQQSFCPALRAAGVLT